MLPYHQPDEARRAQLAELLSHSFGGRVEDKPEWFEALGHDQLRVLTENGQVVAGLGRIPMGQAVGGRFVPMLGVAGVGVRRDRRRRGLARELMTALLQEAREQGIGLSTLYASSQPLYRSLGYEQAGVRMLGEVATRDLPRFQGPGEVERAAPAHHGEVDALYRELALHHPGHLDRGAYVWRRVREERQEQPAFGALLRDAEGALEGYLYYRLEEGAQDFLRVELTDALARSPQGWRRVWAYLADLGSMARSLRMPTAPCDPLYLLLPHPYMELRLHESWMVRIIDPVVALSQRGWHGAGEGSISLHLIDPLLGDRRIRLRVAGGRAEVQGGGQDAVAIHIRGLAALYMGQLGADQLAAVGLIDADRDQRARLDALFAGPQPWLRDFF